MEKKTFDLTHEVLRRFERAGILRHLVLIGSWSVYFYRYYFKSNEYSSIIRTMDIDFLVPLSNHLRKNVRVIDILEDLGFIEEYKGTKGYTKISHPDLTVEFLVPERGQSRDLPRYVPQLSINAIPLRFLDFLANNTVSINAEGQRIIVPHPAAYALHKCVICKRRRSSDKHDRDMEGAVRVFHALLRDDDTDSIKRIFKKIPIKWQATVITNLKSVDETGVIDILR